MTDIVKSWRSHSGLLVEVYQSEVDDQFRWHARNPQNGKIVAQGESHPSKYNAERAARGVFPEPEDSDA